MLQLLADASGQNIVVSDTVRGSVTLRLQSVPWDQALDIVLRTKGLDKRRDGNVIIVAPSEELASREKADLASKKDIQELAPLRTEYLQINYAKATDLAALLKGGANANSVLSTRGSVAVDERTNTLLLVDTSEGLDAIRKMVATLDIPVQAGADRVAPGHRQRRLRARPRRAFRLHRHPQQRQQWPVP